MNIGTLHTCWKESEETCASYKELHPVRYNCHGSSGSQCPRQELTGCSVLTQGQESHSALHPALGLCQHSAPVLSGGKFQLPRADKCRLLHTHGVHKRKPSNLRFTNDPPQVIQKKKNQCPLKIKACVLLLPTMQAFFFQVTRTLQLLLWLKRKYSYSKET